MSMAALLKNNGAKKRSLSDPDVCKLQSVGVRHFGHETPELCRAVREFSANITMSLIDAYRMANIPQDKWE